MKDWVMELVASFPFLKSFLDMIQLTACEKYLKQRVDLSDLIMDSRAVDINTIHGYFTTLRSKFNRMYEEEKRISWSVMEFLTMWSQPRRYWERMRVELGDEEYIRVFNAPHRSLMRANPYCAEIFKRISVDRQRNVTVSKMVEAQTKMTQQFLKREVQEMKEAQDMYDEMVSNLSDTSSYAGSSEVVSSNEAIVNVRGDLPFESHDPTSVRHLAASDKDIMDDLTQAAFNFNLNRMTDGSLTKPYSKQALAKLVEKFTYTGQDSKCIVTRDEALDALNKLKDAYCVEADMIKEEWYKKLKITIYSEIKTLLKSGACDSIISKVVHVIKGVAGAGKTYFMETNFDPLEDAYISPMASVLMDTNRALKSKFGDNIDFRLKTFEKFTEIKKTGGTLYIDEAGAFNRPYLIMLMLYFDYKRYVFLGDDEQTKFYDVAGTLGDLDFSSLVERKNMTRMYASFRYGPTVAAYLNSAFNYPVFSLCSHDTQIEYHHIDSFNGSTQGANITVTGATITYYMERSVTNIQTAKSSQGRTLPVVNVIYRSGDIPAAVAFRANGIVASSRCSEKLNIYIDYHSKRSKEKRNLMVMADNYSAMFDVLLPNESDF
jgi:hypothetical protein